MNYVILDFEWNQNMYKTGVHLGMPFEIIEIGAVKMNAQFQIIDTYSQIIKPKLYKKLHYKTKELTGITEEILEEGIPFSEAAVDFLLWCGEDYIFGTWGNTDLLEFQRNLVFYQLLDLFKGPVKYLNIQKIFRLFYSETHINSSLEAAADYFKIDDCGGFHRALADARYTALVFAKMDIKKVLANYTIDFYQYPQNKKEELHLTYDTYYKYVSTACQTKEAALENKELRATRCYKCGKNAQKKLRWFTSKTKNYYCMAYCNEHGWIRGKIKFKKMDDGQYVAVKTLRITDLDTAIKLKAMKKEAVEKRREKRHKEKV